MRWFGKDDGQEKLIRAVAKKISGDYPQFAHTRPQVSERSDGSYLLVYEEKLRTGDGLSIMSRLRVVADANGEILKISVSR
mgnify:CR=1 FL=1